MTEPGPLTFTDEQILAALKEGPDSLRTQVSIIAMQLELQERRAEDDG